MAKTLPSDAAGPLWTAPGVGPTGMPGGLTAVELLQTEPLPVVQIEGMVSRRLTEREIQIVKALVKIFANGFADQTMSDLAVRSGSSLRSLYQLAPSRTKLVLLVMNQSLRTLAHESRRAADQATTPLEAVALYVHRTAMSVAKLSQKHARDLAAIPDVAALASRYTNHRIASLDLLFRQAILVGEIPEIDTNTFATASEGFIVAFAGAGSGTQKAKVQNVDVALAALLTGLVHQKSGKTALWKPDQR